MTSILDRLDQLKTDSTPIAELQRLILFKQLYFKLHKDLSRIQAGATLDPDPDLARIDPQSRGKWLSALEQPPQTPRHWPILDAAVRGHLVRPPLPRGLDTPEQHARWNTPQRSYELQILCESLALGWQLWTIHVSALPHQITEWHSQLCGVLESPNELRGAVLALEPDATKDPWNICWWVTLAPHMQARAESDLSLKMQGCTSTAWKLEYPHP